VNSAPEDLHASSTELATPALRVLCLGNDLLGDDALGCVVADRLRGFASPNVDICCTPESGLHLLDRTLGVRCLVVVDTVQTGDAPPGTIYQFLDSELPMVLGGVHAGSPHYVGLCEALALARKLNLPVAQEVIVLAVEAVECRILGAAMSPQVSSTIPALVDIVRNMMPAVNANADSNVAAVLGSSD
jgi:hydrogenase maturation protease